MTRAAATAYRAARHAHGRAALAEKVADGADGTPTMRVDALVEDAVGALFTFTFKVKLAVLLGVSDKKIAFAVPVLPTAGWLRSSRSAR